MILLPTKVKIRPHLDALESGLLKSISKKEFIYLWLLNQGDLLLWGC